jgi:hypothetical protein
MAEIRMIRPNIFKKSIGVAVDTGALNTLQVTLAELKKRHGSSQNTLSIALMPPLVQLRYLELPKLSANELKTVVGDKASRYFPSVTEAQIIGSQVVAVGGAKSVYLIAAAAKSVVDSITHAATSAGWEVGTIIPAYSAWVAAALQRWPVLKSTSGDVSVRLPGLEVLEVLQISRGKLTGLRRLRSSEPRSISREIERPVDTAALYAPLTTALELVSESAYRNRRTTRKHNTLIAACIGIIALILTGALGLFYQHRALRSAERERAAIRVQVAQAISGQKGTSADAALMATLKRLENSGPLWSGVITNLAEHLPDDSYALVIRGRGDTIIVDGSAGRAAGVFDGLRRSLRFNNVRPLAPIRREARKGDEPTERFSLAAQAVGGWTSLPLPPPVKKKPATRSSTPTPKVGS